MYKKPIEKISGDLQWRISHWILATNRYKVHLNPLQGEECLFCGISETVSHIFIGCSRLSGILGVLRDVSNNLGFIFTNIFFIFGPKYSASNKSKIVLINVLFGKAKMAIWLTRKRKMLFNNDTDPLPMFRAMVKSRLVVEYKYYEMVNDTESFFFFCGELEIFYVNPMKREVVIYCCKRIWFQF